MIFIVMIYVIVIFTYGIDEYKKNKSSRIYWARLIFLLTLDFFVNFLILYFLTRFLEVNSFTFIILIYFLLLINYIYFKLKAFIFWIYGQFHLLSTYYLFLSLLTYFYFDIKYNTLSCIWCYDGYIYKFIITVLLCLLYVLSYFMFKRIINKMSIKHLLLDLLIYIWFIVLLGYIFVFYWLNLWEVINNVMMFWYMLVATYLLLKKKVFKLWLNYSKLLVIWLTVFNILLITLSFVM